jgi:hypothetical protein
VIKNGAQLRMNAESFKQDPGTLLLFLLSVKIFVGCFLLDIKINVKNSALSMIAKACL